MTNIEGRSWITSRRHRVTLELNEHQLDALHEALGDLITKRRTPDPDQKTLFDNLTPVLVRQIEGILQQLNDIEEMTSR